MTLQFLTKIFRIALFGMLIIAQAKAETAQTNKENTSQEQIWEDEDILEDDEIMADED